MRARDLRIETLLEVDPQEGVRFAGERALILRYMHPSPAAKDAAISLLDAAGSQLSGDMLETGSATQGKTGG